jgi:argininosuccinate synthase
MNITVSVDLNEFYTDEESRTFGDQIKHYIASQVKNQMWNEFKEKALESFNSLVKSEITLEKDVKIKQTVDDLFKSKKLKKQYSSELVSFEEYIEKSFEDHTINSRDFNSNLDSLIRKQATVISNELKQRYDLLFASQIVANLNNNGLLKDEAAKLLLSNTLNP